MRKVFGGTNSRYAAILTHVVIGGTSSAGNRRGVGHHSTSPALLLNLTTPVAESGCTVSALVHVPDQDAASTASVPAATAFAPGEEQLPLKLRAIF